MKGGNVKNAKQEVVPPPNGVLKFNVDGVK